MARRIGWFCIWGAAILAVIGAFSGKAHAGSNFWDGGIYSCTGATFPEVIACVEAAYYADVTYAVPCTSGSQSSYGVNTSGPPVIYQARVTFTRDISNPFDCGNPATYNSAYFFFTEQCAPNDYEAGYGCVEPFDCGPLAGQVRTVFYAGSTPSTAVCYDPMETEECAMTATDTPFCNAGECVSKMAYTGATCGSEVTPGDADFQAKDSPVNCIAGDGNTVCFSESAQNCGYINGESVCLAYVPSGNCTFLGNGGLICDGSVSGAPGPTEGDGTTPATPDGSFQADTGSGPTEYDYYGPSTVADSGSPVSGSGESLEGDETGECQPEWLCEEGEIPTLEALDGEATVFGNFMGRVENSNLVSGIDGAIGTLPEGECPAPSIELDFIGVELTLDAHCALWEGIVAVLQAVMLAVWIFLGIRIVMSA